MKAREVIWMDVCKYLSQFFQIRRRFSSQLKECFIPFNEFYCGAVYFLDCICKFIAWISTVNKKNFYCGERVYVKTYHLLCSFSVGYISRCNMDCMRQAESIHYDMQFYSWHFFPSVIPFSLGSIRIFYAFCIYDAKCSFIFF